MGVAKKIAVTIPRGQYKNLKPAMNINIPIEAPITKGTVLGQVEVKLEGNILSSSPLIFTSCDWTIVINDRKTIKKRDNFFITNNVLLIDKYTIEITFLKQE